MILTPDISTALVASNDGKRHTLLKKTFLPSPDKHLSNTITIERDLCQLRNERAPPQLNERADSRLLALRPSQ